ncbi:MAG: DNA alkylation repair protein [Candidatus Saccharibacteria bacterium]|nr:DNA alkylation repair protein [Candidatus Saccharibacteria bacterium]
MDLNDFRSKLASLADDNYREFTMKGIPCERPFIGVRMPEIRRLVSKIPPENFQEFLDFSPVAFEEVLARGMVVSRLPYDKMMRYFDSQVSLIDNWCSCDSFVTELRPLVKKHLAEFLDLKIEGLLRTSDEFKVRVGLVMLLNFYVEFDYLFLIFDRVEGLAEREEYYIKMAVAWLIAECFIKFPDETFRFLRKTRLSKWTFNKAISKICDSRRVLPEVKEELRGMRK